MRILQAIELAPEPLTVEAIAAQTGLHANTVRGHLDVLLAGEQIGREAAGHQGRGRPRWLYRPTPAKASPFQALAEALTVQLSASSKPAMAQVAAERWAQALPALPRAGTPDEAVAEAAVALNHLGFTAVATGPGDTISITVCPYAQLADSNPVICEIHAALLSRLLEQTGQPVSLASLDVWTRPGVCVARLDRPDLTPSRVISTEGESS